MTFGKIAESESITLFIVFWTSFISKQFSIPSISSGSFVFKLPKEEDVPYWLSIVFEYKLNESDVPYDVHRTINFISSVGIIVSQSL